MADNFYLGWSDFTTTARLGHANKSVTDVYSKLKDDVTFRKKVVEQVGIGFELSIEKPEVAANCTQTTLMSTSAYGNETKEEEWLPGLDSN
jgi:hypothetical protein